MVIVLAKERDDGDKGGNVRDGDKQMTQRMVCANGCNRKN